MIFFNSVVSIVRIIPIELRSLYRATLGSPDNSHRMNVKEFDKLTSVAVNYFPAKLQGQNNMSKGNYCAAYVYFNHKLMTIVSQSQKKHSIDI